MRLRQPVLVILMALTVLIAASTAAAASATSRRALDRRMLRHRAPAVAPGTGGAGMPGQSAPSGTAETPGAPSTPSAPGMSPQPTVPGEVAKIVDGEAYAPAAAPLAVQEAIWAGDAIRHKPYVYGGGHGRWKDIGYDCSGSVSYVLHAAGLIKTSMDSGQFETWGEAGLGQWITVYANAGHAFVQIAGIRLDTSSEQDPGAASGSGPRWRPLMKSTTGYEARHPLGY